MEIINITPRGYCKGVVKAIQMAKQASLDFPNQKITVLGELVHNDHVVSGLKEMHIDTIESKNTSRLELLESVNEGVVIFTAHGINKKVIEKANNKGLIGIDASCEDVISTQNLVESYLNNNYDILYIGKEGHPESEAICSSDPKHIHLITKLLDIDHLNLQNDKLFLTNQTTMSLLDIMQIIDKAKLKYPQLIVSNEVCSATRLRQEAVLNLKKVDCLIVVGDPKSNNSTMLAKLGQNKGIESVYFIQSYQDLIDINLKQYKSIAITSGASTPTFITNQVIAFCEAIRDQKNPIEEASKIKAFL